MKVSYPSGTGLTPTALLMRKYCEWWSNLNGLLTKLACRGTEVGLMAVDPSPEAQPISSNTSTNKLVGHGGTSGDDKNNVHEGFGTETPSESENL